MCMLIVRTHNLGHDLFKLQKRHRAVGGCLKVLHLELGVCFQRHGAFSQCVPCPLAHGKYNYMTVCA